uniref:Uncharacterized protein n=1 Tax=Myotis myotis TaxID=51298 RepID=A0A7J7RTA4_MYOMY|nr:hypothetical protein mMyoMyo1_010177 [Myotis myotis]
MSQAFSPGRTAPPSGSEPCPGAVMLKNTHSCGRSRAPLGGVALFIHSASCQTQGPKCWESQVARKKRHLVIWRNCWDCIQHSRAADFCPRRRFILEPTDGKTSGLIAFLPFWHLELDSVQLSENLY